MPFVVFVGLDWDTKSDGPCSIQDGSPRLPSPVHPSVLWIDSWSDSIAFLTNIATVSDSLLNSPHFTLPELWLLKQREQIRHRHPTTVP